MEETTKKKKRKRKKKKRKETFVVHVPDVVSGIKLDRNLSSKSIGREHTKSQRFEQSLGQQMDKTSRMFLQGNLSTPICQMHRKHVHLAQVGQSSNGRWDWSIEGSVNELSARIRRNAGTLVGKRNVRIGCCVLPWIGNRSESQNIEHILSCFANGKERGTARENAEKVSLRTAGQCFH
jgi:hypothetical protein